MVTFVIVEREDRWSIGDVQKVENVEETEDDEETETEFLVHKEVCTESESTAVDSDCYVTKFMEIEYSLLSSAILPETNYKLIYHSFQIACYHSPVMNAAFNSEFIEGQTKIYRLEDTTARAFQFFVQWLYSQKLHVQQLQDDWVNDSDKSSNENIALSELWVLAEKMSMPQLQNAAIEIINEVHDKAKVVPTKSLHYVHSHTSEDSLLRKYRVSLLAEQLHYRNFRKNPSSFPHGILIDLAILHAKRRTSCPRITISEFHVKVDE